MFPTSPRKQLTLKSKGENWRAVAGCTGWPGQYAKEWMDTWTFEWNETNETVGLVTDKLSVFSPCSVQITQLSCLSCNQESSCRLVFTLYDWAETGDHTWQDISPGESPPSPQTNKSLFFLNTRSHFTIHAAFYRLGSKLLRSLLLYNILL